MESNPDNIINEKGTKQNIVRDEEIVTYKSLLCPTLTRNPGPSVGELAVTIVI